MQIYVPQATDLLNLVLPPETKVLVSSELLGALELASTSATATTTSTPREVARAIL